MNINKFQSFFLLYFLHWKILWRSIRMDASERQWTKWYACVISKMKSNYRLRDWKIDEWTRASPETITNRHNVDRPSYRFRFDSIRFCFLSIFDQRNAFALLAVLQLKSERKSTLFVRINCDALLALIFRMFFFFVGKGKETENKREKRRYK